MQRAAKVIRLAVLTCALVALAGCASSDKTEKSAKPIGNKATTVTSHASSEPLTTPTDLVKAGSLTFCTDMSSPPLEFLMAKQPAGADIEFAREIARRLKLKPVFRNVGFSNIISELRSNTCDAIISGMSDTAERRVQIDFIHYLNVGQSLMVSATDKDEISGFDDLAGKRVSVAAGTTNERYLDEQNDGLSQSGGAPIHVVTFQKDNEAAAAVKAGKADAYFADSPVVAYYISENAGSYAFAGPPINPGPIGIAVRKDSSELRASLTAVVDEMRTDGSLDKILRRWSLSTFAL